LLCKEFKLIVWIIYGMILQKSNFSTEPETYTSVQVYGFHILTTACIWYDQPVWNGTAA